MRCPVIGGGAGYEPASDATNYNTLHGQTDWRAAPTGWYQIVPCPGKFSELLLTLRTDPGAGKSVTLNLYKNGAATALSATVVGGTHKAEDIINQVAAVDGDRVCVQHVPSGGPFITSPRYMVIFTPDDPTKGIILGNTEGQEAGELNDTDTEYASIACGGVRLSPGGDLPSIWPQPTPTSGKFTYARVTLTGAPDPGGSDGYTFTLQKNGIDTAIVVTITGDNTTGTATADVTFAADDYFNWKIAPSGTPSVTPSAAWGIVYQPDISGEAIIFGSTRAHMHQTNTEHNVMTHWSITPWATFDVTYHDYENTIWKMTIKKLHILLETAPGVGWILQEHYDAAYDGAIAHFGVNWEAQTFTPSATHDCKKVALHIARVGDLTGVNLTVAIRNTTGGHPTGGDLVSKTVDANSISTSYAWVEFEFASSVSLSSGTKYAVVARLDGGDGTHYMNWRGQTGNPYADGNTERSSNSGGSWNAYATHDYNFREYELGADKSYTYILYKRTWGEAGGANTLLSVAISGTDTAGGDDVNEVSASDYDGIRMKCVPDGTPDLSRTKWGIVMDVPPLPGGTGSIKQQMVKKLLV